MINAPAGYVLECHTTDTDELAQLVEVPIIAWADNGHPMVLDEETGHLILLRDLINSSGLAVDGARLAS